jgi:GT2 family glycosyltransferase
MSKAFIGIPILNRLDLLKESIGHIDYPADIVIINNNSVDRSFREELHHFAKENGIEVIDQLYNRGVAASWNCIIRTGISRGHDLIFIGSNDTFLTPGSIKTVVEFTKTEPEVIWHINAWNFFAIHRQAVKLVGWFDENFYPAYLEDQDYAYRCRLAGATSCIVGGTWALHLGSQTIHSDPEYYELNIDTHHNWNENHYRAKWGGDRGAERFRRPYDRPDKDWKWWPDPGDTIAQRDWDRRRRAELKP